MLLSTSSRFRYLSRWSRGTPALRFFSSESTLNRHALQGPHGSYVAEYDQSITDPNLFWRKKAQDLHWYRDPSTILSSSAPNLFEWYPDGQINMCYNCLDVHIENGRGDQHALVYDSPLTNVKIKFTFRELLEQVAAFAGGLQNTLGVGVGDRVVIYCPQIPEALIAMLACSRIGAIHSVVFGGFASPELAARIADCRPKVIVSASAGIEPNRIIPYKPLLDRALDLVTDHVVEKCVIVQRDNVERCTLGPRDVDFHELLANSEQVPAVSLPSTHPHYVLYTSGTTGKPKGVVRDTGSSAVALKYSMNAFYSSPPGQVFWAASDLGWQVGHSYIVYGPLLQGCTTVLYEGKPVGTPDAGAFWRIIEEFRVKTLCLAPTALRAIKQADPMAEFVKQYDLSSLQAIFLAGEHSDPDTLHWCENALKDYNIPAIDHWWQTELGSPGVGNPIGLGFFRTKYGACAAPVPGFAVEILDDEGNRQASNQLGNMVLKLPLPPGTLTSLYRNDQGFFDSYLKRYPGYYETGDAGYIDDDGYIFIMGRTDDVINTAGHRLSTGAMEEILMEHSEVAECAVIGVKDAVKGQIPVAFVTLIAGSKISHDDICFDLIQMVRETLGPVASFKKVGIVSALPKTRSGKILRGTMSKIANGEEYTVTPTIEDPKIFDYLEPMIRKLMDS